METLYDVFSAIRDDEAEHVATMRACKDPRVLVIAPSVELAVALVGTAAAVAAVASDSLSNAGVPAEDISLEAGGDIGLELGQLGILELLTGSLLALREAFGEGFLEFVENFLTFLSGGGA